MRRHVMTGLLALATMAGAQARTFQAEGADTGAGLGARWVAQGGTGVASADDVHAIYYNPAGLAEVGGLEFSVSRQLNAELHAINFIGAAWRLPLPDGAGWRATVAAAWYPRIHARASGAYEESDFESLFLRYLLPGVSGTFDGDIDSKTKSTRLAFGAAPTGDAPWSIGGYLERIDCKSNFCGVHATSNGYTVQSTGAKAIGVGLGGRWRLDAAWTLAASLSDLRTRLDVTSTTTDDLGTRTDTSRLAFPRKLALGVDWRYAPDARAALDLESMRGRYGRNHIDLRALRAGVEQRHGEWTWRGGAVVPLRIDSTETGPLHAPFPFAPTLGLGWGSGPWKLDFALYAHALMSMHKDRPSPAADLTLSLRF